MNIINGILRKHWHFIAAAAGASAALALIYALRNALLPFIFGLAFVYFLVPVVSWIERRFPREGRWITWPEGKRVSSIMIVNTGIVGVAGISGFYIFNTIINALSTLLKDAQGHYLAAVTTLQQWTENIRQMVPSGVRERIDLFVINTGTGITAAVEENIRDRVAHMPSTFSSLVGFFALPLFIFYVLKDREKLSAGFYSSMPPWATKHIRNIILIFANVLGQYARSALTLGLAVGLLTLVGLLIIGAPMAPLLAIVAGVTELIPIIGPWIGGAIAAVVTLAIAPEKAVWVVMLAAAIQLLENSLLVPRIQSGYLGIHPAVSIVLIVVGSAVAGVWGMLLFVPLAAIAMQIYRYARQAVQEQASREVPGDG